MSEGGLTGSPLPPPQLNHLHLKLSFKKHIFSKIILYFAFLLLTDLYFCIIIMTLTAADPPGQKEGDSFFGQIKNH